MIGGAVVGAVATRFAPRRLAVFGGICAGVGLIVIVNQPSIYVAIALVAVLGFVFVAAEVGWDTLLQLGSDDDNRGRVSALLSTVAALSTIIGIALTSALADRVGAVTMLDIGGLAMIAGGVLALTAPNIRSTKAAPAFPQPAE